MPWRSCVTPRLALSLSLTFVGTIVGVAHADEVDAVGASGAAEAPPLAPFRRGVAFEGMLGTYAPAGPLKHVSAPGPWFRVTVGFDFTKWFGAFASGDVAFLSTERAPPPPGPRAYTFYGFGGGLRLALPIGRVRIPVRAEIGLHEAKDDGVLAAYGFRDAHGLSFGWALATGLEIRAKSRHYGLGFEVGVRNDSAFANPVRGGSPLAITGALLVHYTL
ncbi:MAG: hypothetical protein IPJ34_29765 [Myxococcales bacterium]|nr:hypothetical protein [Myxococcales bacterium]